MSMMEIILILAIALIVIGPKKLPELAKTLGRIFGEFRRTAYDFKESINLDSELNDVKKSFTDLNHEDQAQNKNSDKSTQNTDNNNKDNIKS